PAQRDEFRGRPWRRRPRLGALGYFVLAGLDRVHIAAPYRRARARRCARASPLSLGARHGRRRRSAARRSQSGSSALPGSPARGLGNPSMIGLSLAALAGALADRDPDRAAALLHEDIERWVSRDYENPAEVTNAALISARIRDWPTALELAPRAIRHLHWTGD